MQIMMVGVPDGYTLTVTKAGDGAGTVTSNPAGINCGTDCNEIFWVEGTVVTLTATPAAGSTFAGYMLAVLAILSTAKVGTLLVALGVPIIDTGYTVIRRILSGKSPVWGDRGHLHHKLLDAGMTKRQVAFFYWTVTAGLGITALNLNAAYKFYTIVGVTIFVGGLILWLTYRPKI